MKQPAELSARFEGSPDVCRAATLPVSLLRLFEGTPLCGPDGGPLSGAPVIFAVVEHKVAGRAMITCRDL